MIIKTKTVKKESKKEKEKEKVALLYYYYYYHYYIDFLFIHNDSVISRIIIVITIIAFMIYRCNHNHNFYY